MNIKKIRKINTLILLLAMVMSVLHFPAYAEDWEEDYAEEISIGEELSDFYDPDPVAEDPYFPMEEQDEFQTVPEYEDLPGDNDPEITEIVDEIPEEPEDYDFSDESGLSEIFPEPEEENDTELPVPVVAGKAVLGDRNFLVKPWMWAFPIDAELVWDHSSLDEESKAFFYAMIADQIYENERIIDSEYFSFSISDGFDLFQPQEGSYYLATFRVSSEDFAPFASMAVVLMAPDGTVERIEVFDQKPYEEYDVLLDKTVTGTELSFMADTVCDFLLISIENVFPDLSVNNAVLTESSFDENEGDGLPEDEELTEGEEPAEDEELSEDEELAQDEESAEDEELSEGEEFVEDEDLSEDEGLSEDEELTEDEDLAEDEEPAEDEELTEDEEPAEDEEPSEDEELAEDEEFSEDEELTDGEEFSEEEEPEGDENPAESEEAAEERKEDESVQDLPELSEGENSPEDGMPGMNDGTDDIINESAEDNALSGNSEGNNSGAELSAGNDSGETPVALPPAEPAPVLPQTKNIRAIAYWVDSGYEKMRPAALSVVLYRTDSSGRREPVSSVSLPYNNSWYYTWEGLDIGYEYSVVESTPDGYTASVTSAGDSFFLKNTINTSSAIPATGISYDPVYGLYGGGYYPALSSLYLPQTGALWWPVPVLATAGIVMLLVGLKKRRGESNE